MARIVVALGGNALQKNGETDAESQKSVARGTARQLVGLIREGHELIIAHGNGPQVGTILLNEEAASDKPAPLDTCVAMSQGEIGYWLQQAVYNELKAVGLEANVATIVTQVVVSSDDPAFKNPTKPIGPFYPDEATARKAAEARQFIVKEDAGRGWRRVVASPRPIDILEKDVIQQVVERKTIVIAAGGGGVPVISNADGIIGVEAVIDKDFAAEKLAELVKADVLLILTAVDAVSINFRKPEEETLRDVVSNKMESYVNEGHFAPGSMLPKVQACLQFVAQKGAKEAIITSPQKVAEALRGEAGTRIIPG